MLWSPCPDPGLTGKLKGMGVQAWQDPDSNSVFGFGFSLGYTSWVGFAAGWRFIVCIYIEKAACFPASVDVPGTVQMGLVGHIPTLDL